MSIKVAIVEDQDAVRAGIAEMIHRPPEVVCIGQYGDAESALKHLPTLDADVVLMDLALPGIDGIEAIRRLRLVRPELQVLVLTVYQDDDRIFESLKAGANGYVLKTTPTAELNAAIKAVSDGESPMSGEIARRVVQSFHQPVEEFESLLSLTERENEILDLLVAGYRYKEIAFELTISIDTVRTHIRHVYEKLQVRSRAEATAKVLGQR